MHGVAARVAAQDTGATIFRVFLKDGGTLVSYGEIARVGERVVFSMPTGLGNPPPLHLTNLAADRIDWARTDRYAESARSGRYIETQAENDYTVLSNQVADALNAVGQTTDPARRLDLVERARRALVAWPPDHYNYRANDIRQLVTMLDSAIADLRSAGQSQQGQFAFNLVALSGTPPSYDALLPAPTLKESIEQVLLAARVSDTPSERVALYQAAHDELALYRNDPALTTVWVTTTSASIRAAITTEEKIDRSYRALAQRMMALADVRAKDADVRGLEQLAERVRTNDAVLGNARPDVVESLLAAIQDKLDAARRLQLARDRYALRAPVFARYRLAMRGPLDQFAELKSALEDIKSLAGTPPGTLQFIDDAVARLSATAATIEPPDELVEAHALFVSAVNLAHNAASIRREATMKSSIERAWDASSAAAGALMLGAKARTEIQKLLRRPQVP